MNDRIKEVRKMLGLTQQKFADSIGVKQNTVAQYEMGRNIPMDSVVNLICAKFNINETWLRTGEGEMKREMSRNEEIAEYLGALFSGKHSDFERKFISAVSQLSPEQWALMEDFVKKLAAEEK